MTTTRTLVLSSPGVLDATGNLAGSLTTTSVTLTQAQIVLLFTTPVTLVAAGGSGVVNIPVSITTKLNNPGPAAAFSGGGVVGFGWVGALTAAGTVPATAVTTALVANYSTAAMAVSTATDVRNAALVISNATAVFAAGAATSTLTIDVTYKTLTGQ